MWNNPPKNLALTSSEIAVWRMNLNLSSTEVQKRLTLLNSEEQSKAKRFHFEQHQRRFIVARSTLKMILGQYLNIAPQTIEFEYSSRGKPRLSDHLSGDKIQFNTSHSEELAIYAITCDRPIGVDVEYIRTIKDAKHLAQRFFTPQEYEQISPLSSPDLEKAFFQLWTAKEAYLKATGEGIAGGLDQVEVCLTPPLKLINLPQNQSRVNWTISSFMPHPNYQGAVVVQGDCLNINYWQL